MAVAFHVGDASVRRRKRGVADAQVHLKRRSASGLHALKTSTTRRHRAAAPAGFAARAQRRGFEIVAKGVRDRLRRCQRRRGFPI
eukprot:scaffold8558_cov229-Pinguiococcus_pyrenoidosus.AAC.1